MARDILVIFCLVLALANLSTGSPVSVDQVELAKESVVRGIDSEAIDIYEKPLLVNDDDNDLLPYDPIAVRRNKYESTQVRDGKDIIRPSLNLEQESSISNKKSKGNMGERVEASLADDLPDSPNVDRFGSIAYNSREVRYVGPTQKEVEMKGDVASKMFVALDNLQKEASEVWGQVNDKLDKGWKDIKRSEVWGQVNDKLDKSWTDLKAMVENVVNPASKRQP